MSRFWSANKWWVLSKRSIQASGVEFPRVLRTIRFSVQFELIANFTGHFYTSAYQGHIQLRLPWQSRTCALWILMPILSNLLWHYCSIDFWQSSKYGSLACMRKFNYNIWTVKRSAEHVMFSDGCGWLIDTTALFPGVNKSPGIIHAGFVPKRHGESSAAKKGYFVMSR